MKVLIMPLFQFPTGHTKVGETMEDAIRQQYPDAIIETIDFLTYCRPILEKFVAGFYMQWLNIAPSLYQSIYRGMMNDKYAKRPKFITLWSLYFERKMKQLLAKSCPDLIVCTHSFPSKLIGGLIAKKHIKEIPVVNVYTDLFMNGVWASEGIKYHLVPHQEARKTLIERHQIPGEHIYVTGIPIHRAFKRSEKLDRFVKPHVLVAGGNTGLINEVVLTKLFTMQPLVYFTVLCGKNRILYDDLARGDFPNVRLMMYLDCPEEMNALYDEVDAIITKPGGVTMSEVMLKQLPIFISHALPGPEEINLAYLLKRGMARKISLADMDGAAAGYLCDSAGLAKMLENINDFLNELDCTVTEALCKIVTEEKHFHLSKKAITEHFVSLDKVYDM